MCLRQIEVYFGICVGMGTSNSKVSKYVVNSGAHFLYLINKVVRHANRSHILGFGLDIAVNISALKVIRIAFILFPSSLLYTEFIANL